MVIYFFHSSPNVLQHWIELLVSFWIRSDDREHLCVPVSGKSCHHSMWCLLDVLLQMLFFQIEEVPSNSLFSKNFIVSINCVLHSFPNSPADLCLFSPLGKSVLFRCILLSSSLTASIVLQCLCEHDILNLSHFI